MFDKIEISPADIRHKEFKTSAIGYNKTEIRDYLDTLAEHFEELYSQRLSSTKEAPQVNVYEDRTQSQIAMEQIQKREELISKALIQAENTRNEIIRTAQKEADNIIKDAELSAKKAIDETKHYLNLMKHEYINLKENHKQFLINSHSQLKGQLTRYEQDNLYSKETEAEMDKKFDEISKIKIEPPTRTRDTSSADSSNKPNDASNAPANKPIPDQPQVSQPTYTMQEEPPAGFVGQTTKYEEPKTSNAEILSPPPPRIEEPPKYEEPRPIQTEAPRRYEEPQPAHTEPPRRYEEQQPVHTEPPRRYEEPQPAHTEPPRRYEEPQIRQEEPSFRFEEPSRPTAAVIPDHQNVSPPPRYEEPRRQQEQTIPPASKPQYTEEEPSFRFEEPNRIPMESSRRSEEDFTPPPLPSHLNADDLYGKPTQQTTQPVNMPPVQPVAQSANVPPILQDEPSFRFEEPIKYSEDINFDFEEPNMINLTPSSQFDDFDIINKETDNLFKASNKPKPEPDDDPPAIQFHS